MIKNFPIIIFFFLASLGFSQAEQDSTSIKQDRDGVLEQRTFEDDLSDKYTGEEFNYDIKTGEAQNLLARFLNWFSQLLRDTFGINVSPGMMQLMEYLIYILMGSLVIYLLVRFFVGENLSSLFTKKAVSLMDINLSEEHIDRIDLDALIKEALERRDYRLAIRYQFLRILKVLSQKGIIDWHYEKTNSDYKREIEQPDIKARFQEVSYLYDYIWYGEQEIGERDYNAAQELFKILKNNLSD